MGEGWGGGTRVGASSEPFRHRHPSTGQCWVKPGQDNEIRNFSPTDVMPVLDTGIHAYGEFREFGDMAVIAAGHAPGLPRGTPVAGKLLGGWRGRDKLHVPGTPIIASPIAKNVFTG